MHTNRGFTLIELIAFLVVVGVSMVAIGSVFLYATERSQNPLINSRMLAMAQSQLDEISSRKFDENTPTGGVPACDTTINNAVACSGIGLDTAEILTSSSTLDDVDDFHLYQDEPDTGFLREVVVVMAGDDFGVSNDQAKRITVTITSPQGVSMSLSTYRFNF
ncbi:type IV pilus modification PilV family protein [Eionea flava]